jgi:hypothetical protein
VINRGRRLSGHEHQHDSMWTEGTWREREDHADQVTVEVRFKE